MTPCLRQFTVLLWSGPMAPPAARGTGLCTAGLARLNPPLLLHAERDFPHPNNQATSAWLLLAKCRCPLPLAMGLGHLVGALCFSVCCAEYRHCQHTPLRAAGGQTHHNPPFGFGRWIQRPYDKDIRSMVRSLCGPKEDTQQEPANEFRLRQSQRSPQRSFLMDLNKQASTNNAGITGASTVLKYMAMH